MKFTGFLCEYNPFHRGHLHHLQKSQALGAPTVCILSGCFVQRGEAAVTDPWARAQAALRLGCDLVILLPTFYSLSPGEYFAKAAMTMLTRLGATAVTFGSPVTDAGALRQVAAHLAEPAVQEAVRAHLQRGYAYPRAVESALAAVHPETATAAHEILSHANATLGLEYLKSLQDAGYRGEVEILHRGADSVSATAIRSHLRQGERHSVLQDMPDAMLQVLPEKVVDNGPLGTLFAYQARLGQAVDLPDDGEGIGNLLRKAAMKASSWEDILEAAKTKRYTRTRLQRAILHSLLGIDAMTCETIRRELPLYVYPLALNARGQELLAQWKKDGALPIIDRPRAFVPETEAMAALWQIEERAVQLYALLCPTLDPGALFTHQVVRT